jgi:hypothetical protein
MYEPAGEEQEEGVPTTCQSKPKPDPDFVANLKKSQSSEQNIIDYIRIKELKQCIQKKCSR